MYGLDRFVAPPPFAAIVALLLLAGCDGIGVAVLRASGLCPSDAPRWHRWQAAGMGAMTLALVLYPLALANLTSLAFMRRAAGVVAASGLANTVVAIVKWISRRRAAVWRPAGRKFSGWHVLLVLLLTGAGVMALGPVTDADSLDYHMGVPVVLLNEGGMPVAPEWFHSRIAGSHDVLNALGLAAGAEAFGALLQYAGLFGVAGLLLFAESADDRCSDSTARAIVTVAAVSAPVLVALISPKPQLLPVAMTSLGIALVIYPSRRELTTDAALRGHALICLLVMSASQAKLTYTLGGGVVGLLSLGSMARRRLLWPALGIALVAALVVLMPPVAWKHHYFHDGFINSLIKPAPGSWPGTAVFNHELRRFRDSAVLFPLSLVVPSGLSTVSTIIGPAGLIVLLALRPGRDRWQWTAIAAAIFVLIMSVLLGPSTSRSYLEPYFWLLMVVALQSDQPRLTRARWVTWPVAAQAAFAIGLFWYGAATLFPGAVTWQWRSVVMNRSANGYRVMKWADSKLPSDAVLLSAHRSIALAPRDAVSLDWSSVATVGSPDAEPYLRRLRDRGVTHMLVLGSPPNFMGLSGCAGELVAGPGDDQTAARNPYSGSEHSAAWIFAFNSALLPGCASAHR